MHAAEARWMEIYGLRCCALRGATSDASAPLAAAWLPPQGDESLRPALESTLSIRGSHACLLI